MSDEDKAGHIAQDRAQTPRPKRRGRKRRAGAWTVLAMLLALALLVGLMMRADGVQLPLIAQTRLQEGLNSSLPEGAGLDLGSTKLKLGRDLRPLVEMADVALTDREGRLVATVPRMQVALHRFGLMLGRVQPASVSLEGLRVLVARAEDGAFQISFGSDDPLPTIAGLGDLVALMDETMHLPQLEALDRVVLTDLGVRISDPTAGRALAVQDGRFELSREAGGIAAQLDVSLAGPTRAQAGLSEAPAAPAAEPSVPNPSDPESRAVEIGALSPQDPAPDTQTSNQAPDSAQEIAPEDTSDAAPTSPGDALLRTIIGGGPLGVWRRAPPAPDAQIRIALSTRHGTRAAELEISATELSPQLIAAQSPSLAALSAVQAPVSVSLRGALDEAGLLAALAGTVEAGPGRLGFGGDSTALERLKGYIRLLPQGDVLALESLELRTAILGLDMTGQMRMPQRASQTVEAQLQISDLALRLPEDGALTLPGPVDVSAAQADLRYDLATGGIEIGQISAQVDGARLDLAGQVTPSPAGAVLALSGTVANTDIRRALALWPVEAVGKTRGWLAKNLAEAKVERLDFALRRRPGSRPNVALSAAFTDGHLTFLPEMPDLSAASGFFSLTGTRFALRVDQGEIEAPGGTLSAAGTHFHVVDTTERPEQGRVALRLSGPLTGALALLERDPVNLSLGDLPVTGQARIAAQIAFPLGAEQRPEDVSWVAEGQLSGLVGDGLLQGRSLRARQLSVNATQDSVTVAGAVRVQDVPAQISLTHPLEQARAQPVQVTGRLELSSDALGKLGVDLGGIGIRGTTPARFTLTTGQGQIPALTLRSDLRGLDLRIPALGWGKPASIKGDLRLSAKLSDPVEVPRFTLEGAGLRAAGSVALAPGNGLATARFERVALGDWLDVSATLTGRGPDRPPALAVTGGRLDLRGFSTQQPVGAGQATARGPISLALDRLVVTKGIEVTALRGELAEGAALNGSVRGRLNGKAPVRAVVVANQGRTGVRVQADDAGATLAALGALKNGRGGALDLVLNSRSGGAVSNTWDGSLSIDNLVVVNAPELAGLLSAISVVGILEQMSNGGLSFASTEVDLTLSPAGIALSEGRANGPSMGITFEGLISPTRGQLDLQGVVSPLNILNGIGGALFARRGEGLFGFSYRMAGALSDPGIEVNPLSILTPGVFRDLFRRDPPELQ